MSYSGAFSPSGYDTLVDRLIPGYGSLARLSVALLAASSQARGAGSRVLIAGCGSGAELLQASRLRPDWNLTALDPSPSMLALAQEKLRLSGGAPASIEWSLGTVEDLPDEAAFDGALAVLVLQGLQDDGSKLRFLSSLSRSLRPQAQVVLVDQMQPERSAIESQLLSAREIFQGGEAGPEPSPLNAEKQPALGDIYPVSLARLTGLLEASGFSDPCPVFRALDVEGFLLQKLS